MTLTKNQIIEKVRYRKGFSRKKSAETVETWLEIIKKHLRPVRMSLSVGLASSVLKGRRNAREEILQPVMI